MRSNSPEFPLPPGGPYHEFSLMLRLRSTLCEIKNLPEVEHPGVRYWKGPDLPERDR